MSEEHMCSFCKKGRVRPIQFSIDQAIVKCDNLDCDSFLEKWPWETVISNPIQTNELLEKRNGNKSATGLVLSADKEVEFLLSHINDSFQLPKFNSIQNEGFLEKDLFSNKQLDKISGNSSDLQSHSQENSITNGNDFDILDEMKLDSFNSNPPRENFYHPPFPSEMTDRNQNLGETLENHCQTPTVLSFTPHCGAPANIKSPCMNFIPSCSSAFSPVCSNNLSQVSAAIVSTNNSVENVFPVKEIHNNHCEESILSPTSSINDIMLQTSSNNTFVDAKNETHTLSVIHQKIYNLEFSENFELLNLNLSNYSLISSSNTCNSALNKESLISSVPDSTNVEFNYTNELTLSPLSILNRLSPLTVPEKEFTLLNEDEKKCESSSAANTYENFCSSNTINQIFSSLKVSGEISSACDTAIGTKRSHGSNHRSRTNFTSQFVKDPWSVPEVQLKELDIEVILKNKGEDSVTTSSPKKGKGCVASSQNNGDNDEDSGWNFPNKEDVQDIIPKVKISVPFLEKNILEMKSNLGTSSLNLEESFHDESNKLLSVFEPVVLQPEIADIPYSSDNITSFLNDQGSSELRESVTFSDDDHNNFLEANSQPKDKTVEYFKLVTSNVKFDENFFHNIPKEKQEPDDRNTISKLEMSFSDDDAELKKGKTYKKLKNRYCTKRKKRDSGPHLYTNPHKKDVPTIVVNDVDDVLFESKYEQFYINSPQKKIPNIPSNVNGITIEVANLPGLSLPDDSPVKHKPKISDENTIYLQSNSLDSSKVTFCEKSLFCTSEEFGSLKKCSPQLYDTLNELDENSELNAENEFLCSSPVSLSSSNEENTPKVMSPKLQVNESTESELYDEKIRYNVEFLQNTLTNTLSQSEIIDTLRKCGWVITRNDPSIDYFPPSPTLPTIIPLALKKKYSNLSNNVIWAPVGKIKSPHYQKDSATDNCAVEHSKQLSIENSKPNKIIATEKKPFKLYPNNFTTVGKNGSKRGHISDDNSDQMKKPKLSFSSRLFGKDLPYYEESMLNVNEKLGFVRSIPPIKNEPIKTEPSSPIMDLEDDDEVEEIELPDDFLAYDQVIKTGQFVEPPVRPPSPASYFKNLCIMPPKCIPPPALLTKPSKIKKGKAKSPPKALISSIKEKAKSPPKALMSPDEHYKRKADDMLDSLLSCRSEAPGMIGLCFGKRLYLYERKDP